MMSKTVKAREHYGTESLDLTIPTSVVNDHHLSPGDIFEVIVEEGEEDGEDVIISYELVHRSS